MSWGTRLFDWVGLGLGSRAEPDRSRTAGDWLTAFCSRSWELFFGCTTWHVESFFPRPGSELALPALPGRFLIIGSSGKSGGSY